MAQMIGIKYVGKKNRPQPDTVAGTTLVWSDTREVHFVPEEMAAKFLKHPDVWAQTQEVRVSPAKAKEMTPEMKEEPPEEEQEQAPLVSLDNMDKTALREFAQRQFGQTLHHAMSEENMRGKIRGFMNSPVLGR